MKNLELTLDELFVINVILKSRINDIENKRSEIIQKNGNDLKSGNTLNEIKTLSDIILMYNNITNKIETNF